MKRIRSPNIARDKLKLCRRCRGAARGVGYFRLLIQVGYMWAERQLNEERDTYEINTLCGVCAERLLRRGILVKKW